MNRKIALLEEWLKVNNLAIKNEINFCRDENKYREVHMGLDIMISVLIGENITKGSNFYAIENLVGESNPTINFIRNASFEELYSELTSLSDENNIKRNLSMLNYNKIIELYEEQKAKGEIATDTVEKNTYNIQENLREQPHNPYTNSFQSNEGSLNNQSNNSNNNITFKGTAAHKTSNHSNNNRIDRNYEATKDFVDMCGNSLDCVINGVKVVIIPNEDGSYTVKNQDLYSQSMEIKINGGRSTQVVNKKILTRDEFNCFVEKYEEEIFYPEHSFEKLNSKEKNMGGYNKENEL